MARTQTASRKTKSETPRLEIENPGRGLNSLVSDNNIDDREASALQNIWFVESGVVTKRNGFGLIGTGLSNNPRGLGSYMDSSGNKYLVTIDGTTLKYLKNSFASSSTYTAATGDTLTAGNPVTFTSAGGYLFPWNGVDGGSYFNGTALTRPGTMPKAKFGIYFKGYHIVSGVDGQLNRIYIAEPLDPTDFTNASGASTLNNSTEVPGATSFTDTASSPAQFIDIEKNDGDKVTGLASFQDSIVVFKERSIHQITFDSSGVPSVALVTRSLGCVSHKSIENVENDIFFLSRQGYFVLGNEPNFFSAIRTNELSARVHDDIKLISEGNLSLVTSIFYDYKYLSSVPQGGTTANNVLWTYDRRYLGWSKSSAGSIPLESFTVLIDNDNRERLFATKADSAQLVELNQSYSDGGTAIDAYWVSKAFDLDAPDLQKRWLYVDLMFRQVSGSVEISIFADNDELVASSTIPAALTGGDLGTLEMGLELLGGDADDQVPVTVTTTNIPYRVPIKRNSRTIKVKVANSENNQNFALSGMYFGYIPYSQYKFPSANKLITS